MNDTITTSPVTVPQLQQAALSEIAVLQQAASYKISQLNLPRQQLLEMEVQLRVPNLEALCDGYVNQDIYQLSQNFKLTKAQIYFPPKYILLTRKVDKPYIMTFDVLLKTVVIP